MSDELMQEQFDEMVVAICPHCRAGIPTQHRADTGEFVHHVPVAGNAQSMTICWANGLRNSRFAPRVE